jgi:N-acyl homoserine lactone hydrolase
MEIHRLHLTDVTPSPRLPWARPTYPVFGYLVLHPEAPIVVDTGVGIGHAFIDELYSPVHHDIDDSLFAHGVRIADVATVITSHLHFDHCGQNARFTNGRIIVQRAEVEAAREPGYTVPEWAFPPAIELDVIDGDHEIASGVRVVATPGHTPGHQSVVVDDGPRRTVLCCQASWSTTSFEAATLGDDGWSPEIGVASLDRLHALKPDSVLLSHDPDEWRQAGHPSPTNGADLS